MPLTIKLDDKEFTLSNESLVAMATTLWRTRVKERGLMLCQDTEITPGPEHIGGRGSIGVRNCAGRPRVGRYHTHPTGSSAPSWIDALSTISLSILEEKPMLMCRGAKEDETIRCDTVKDIPDTLDYALLKARARKMRFHSAEADPEIWKYFATPYSFPVRKVPEIIKPPVPVPVVAKIRTEQVEFATSKFLKYINLDTGEVIRIERVY